MTSLLSFCISNFKLSLEVHWSHFICHGVFFTSYFKPSLNSFFLYILPIKLPWCL
uniref:Uncharacterized protein n=1 Tax=Octopus bimaculoides TaxID=37653 RepID=A0A0L8H286_OCTBM